MRQRRWSMCGVVLATLTVCGSSASAQTVAAGPYYATPSWDQTIPCTTAANCPRFVVLSNLQSEVVLDRETGLLWERTPNPVKQEWGTAQQACLNRTTGGRAGWRLPTAAELASLLEPAISFPNLSLPAGHPFVVASTTFFFWTATPGPRTPDTHMDIEFSYLSTFSSEVPNNFTWFAWCVRGPSPS